MAGETPKDLKSVKTVVDRILNSPINQAALLLLGTDAVGVPPQGAAMIAERWDREGQPPLPQYAPYTAHVVSVEAFFGLAIDAGLISRDRPSHRADLAYLYYLPFSMVFASNDKLHRETAPLFMTERQTFVWGEDLKSDLRALDAHYSSLPETERNQGLMRFASAPPKDGGFLVAELWDRFLPSWRNPPPPVKMSNQQERDFMAEFRDARLPDAETDPSQGIVGDDPDFLIIERTYPTTRGKWRILPPGVGKKE
jgi:hypothetical protein